MPQIIHPQVTSTVVIEMSLKEAQVLREALDEVLDHPSPVWVDKKLRDTASAGPCVSFLSALKKTID